MRGVVGLQRVSLRAQIPELNSPARHTLILCVSASRRAKAQPARVVAASSAKLLGPKPLHTMTRLFRRLLGMTPAEYRNAATT